MVTENKAKGSLVARYTERKMSPSTGLDTDYTTEYRMVHNEHPPVEAMGNPYLLYRTLTVGGELRSDDLLESAQTPAKLAVAAPWESSYMKANKFGAFKAEWDKVQAKKEAIKQVEVKYQIERVQDAQRFKDVFVPLQTLKGLKETTIPISNHVAGDTTYSKFETQTVPGYNLGNSIGIAIKGEGKSRSYTVTHLGTGLAMGPDFHDKKRAIALAQAEIMLGDWTRYQSEKDIPKAMLTNAAALVVAANNESLTEKDYATMKGDKLGTVEVEEQPKVSPEDASEAGTELAHYRYQMKGKKKRLAGSNSGIGKTK